MALVLSSTGAFYPSGRACLSRFALRGRARPARHSHACAQSPGRRPTPRVKAVVRIHDVDKMLVVHGERYFRRDVLGVCRQAAHRKVVRAPGEGTQTCHQGQVLHREQSHDCVRGPRGASADEGVHRREGLHQEQLQDWRQRLPARSANSGSLSCTVRNGVPEAEDSP
ncbi:DUF2169 domain-containing protein [Myxococcus landrumensis]|uniref:DUF2169 domain-containing protein n=1 Tax=Myxococcus landrumensis TaxID=2813577 RepID=A0ABX7N3M7_9BACT|nr:DUF2169 domain-containing protein [Myxococcus landrumus]